MKKIFLIFTIAFISTLSAQAKMVTCFSPKLQMNFTASWYSDNSARMRVESPALGISNRFTTEEGTLFIDQAGLGTVFTSDKNGVRFQLGLVLNRNLEYVYPLFASVDDRGQMIIDQGIRCN